jgi:hypothetical protein
MRLITSVIPPLKRHVPAGAPLLMRLLAISEDTVGNVNGGGRKRVAF